MGGHAFVQREQALDRSVPSDVDQAIPIKVRATFPKKRGELAAEFAELSPSQRRSRAPEFRSRLGAICASDIEKRGYWQLKFEPLLIGVPRTTAKVAKPAPARRSRKPPPDRRSRKPPPAKHAKTEAAILAVVRAQPGRLTRKKCVQNLCGSSGRLHGAPVDTVHARIASMVSRGFLDKHPTDGTLTVARAV